MTIGETLIAYRDAALVKFDFLRTEYDFVIEEVDIKNSWTCTIIYTKKKMIIELSAEPLDQRFHYFLKDGVKTIIFHQFFQRYDANINWPELMPLDHDYEKAMDKNILLLKKYGHNFLSGKENL